MYALFNKSQNLAKKHLDDIKSTVKRNIDDFDGFYPNINNNLRGPGPSS